MEKDFGEWNSGSFTSTSIDGFSKSPVSSLCDYYLYTASVFVRPSHHYSSNVLSSLAAILDKLHPYHLLHLRTGMMANELTVNIYVHTTETDMFYKLIDETRKQIDPNIHSKKS